MAETDQEVAPSYTANPNQKVYDTAHVVDHEVNVLDIYFAEKVKKLKWENKSEVYTVRSGGRIVDVTKRYIAPNRRNIQASPNHNNPLAKGDQITVSWEESKEDGFEFKKIAKADLGRKVFIVANCNGAKGKLEVELHENLQIEKEAIFDNPIKFLIADAEKTKVEFTLAVDKTQYEQEIILRPKADKDLEALEEKFNKRTKKEAYVFLKATVTGTDDTVKYPGDLSEFLNKDGERFIIKNCGCVKYFIKNNELNSPNVVLTKTGSLVSGNTGIQTIKAIILHRTAGSTTAGAIAHSKGTHFYVDGARGTDGEIYQAVKLDKYTNHIMNSKARTARLDLQTENTIGIETVGMAYEYNAKNELYNIYGTKIADPTTVSISKGFTDTDNKTFYWDALTDAQVKSVKCLVKTLMDTYSLTVNDIYTHEEIQSKSAGEGAVVKEAIIGLLNECL